MKPFPLETVHKFRSSFQEAEFPTFGVERKGHIYNCFVIPQSKNPELPDFALRATPETDMIRNSPSPEEITVFGVSDSVHSAVRDLVAGHEIDEFTDIGIEHTGRCRMASEREIQNLIQKDLSLNEVISYLRMRLRFFRNLTKYAEKRPQQFTPEDLQEFAGSLQVFKEALK